MDHLLSRKSCQEILAEKQSNPNTRDSQVILISNKIDKRKIAEYAKYGVKEDISKACKNGSAVSGNHRSNRNNY